jgi:hypothetical protein
MANKITKIEVIGSGCANCKKSYAFAFAAAVAVVFDSKIYGYFYSR